MMRKLFYTLLCVSAVFAIFLISGAMAGSYDDYTPASLQGLRALTHSQTVTNGQEVTLYTGVNVLTSSGQDNGFTNTITLANSPFSTSGYVIINADASTNLMAIAKSGNWKSAAIELSAGEMVVVVNTATNAFHASK